LVIPIERHHDLSWLAIKDAVSVQRPPGYAVEVSHAISCKCCHKQQSESTSFNVKIVQTFHLSAMAVTKRNTFRLYLNEEDTSLMTKASEVTELSQAELMSKLMSAALRAVAQNAFRFPLPLKFQILETLQEHPTKLNKGRLSR
jgi:hypothetical protein